MQKRYYSPVKEYSAHRRPHLLFRGILSVIRAFFPKNEVLWKTEMPQDESVFFVCNHTKIYAPSFFISDKKHRARVWANCYFLYPDLCWKHLKNKVLPYIKGKFFLYPIAFLLVPLIVAVFRAFEPIPVFHKSDKVDSMTFKKSIETLLSGVNQVIFPERTQNPVNRYIYQFNHGFPRVAERYYQETGKVLKFYPVYCAQKLHTFVVGTPSVYDPNESMNTQSDRICQELEREIGRLGDSLPAHEVVHY